MSIPKVIIQSWKTKQLQGGMAANVEKVKSLNPDYTYMLFDDADCKAFLLEHFGLTYVHAFEALIPGAFKCDFWRYAYLYINGGVYMDIDMVPLVPLNTLIDPDDEFVSVLDRKIPIIPQCGIWQSFLAVKPKHPALLYALQISFVNIATRRQDVVEDCLSITGPIIMGIAMNLYLQNPETFQKFEEGKHRGYKLYPRGSHYCFNFKGEKIFKTAFEGYKSDYSPFVQFYKNDPRSKGRRILKYTMKFLFFGLIIVAIVAFIYRKKFVKCEESCSIGER